MLAACVLIHPALPLLCDHQALANKLRSTKPPPNRSWLTPPAQTRLPTNAQWTMILRTWNWACLGIRRASEAPPTTMPRPARQPSRLCSRSSHHCSTLNSSGSSGAVSSVRSRRLRGSTTTGALWPPRYQPMRRAVGSAMSAPSASAATRRAR